MAGKKTKAEVKEEVKPDPKPAAQAAVQPVATAPKDPTIAALLALLVGFIIWAPGVGYIYIGKVKKGIIYIIICWVIGVIGIIGGSICCLPFAFPFLFALLVTYDVYLDAKGEKTMLPGFGE
jgi:TM2 domain-containing membrane protein YozV